MPVPYLSLVLPAYNEARRLPPTLERLAEFARGCAFPLEVLIVVEHSADGTLDIASRFAAGQANFQIIGNPVQRGKGYAVRTGMLRAAGEHVFYMDADLSVPLAAVHEFLRHFEANPGAQVLIGNRQHARSLISRRQSPLRERMGKVFNGILQHLAIAGVHDTQCGFKSFRAGACREIFRRQTLNGFAFDVEVLLLAERLGLHIEDLPVEWINSPESKVQIVSDSLRMLRDTLRVRRIVEGTLRATPPVPGAV